MLQEDDRVVTADGRPQQAVRIQGRRGTRHSQTRDSRVDRRSRLRVVDAAALEVAAVCHAHHNRRLESAVATPANERQLVTDLMIGGPNIVEELNLHDWLDPACGESYCTPNDVRFRQRRIVNALGAELLLQTPCDFEDSTLAPHLVDVLLAGNIGDILPKHDNARVPQHLIPHTLVEEIHHGRRIATELRIILGVELLRNRINVGRVHMQVERLRLRLR